MSAYTDDAVVRHSVLDEEMPFLQKPFSPETPARKVRELLEKTQVQQKGAASGRCRLRFDVCVAVTFYQRGSSLASPPGQ